MTLQEIKDKLALEHYRQPFWNLLSEHKQAMLVDIVAREYSVFNLKEMASAFAKQNECQHKLIIE